MEIHESYMFMLDLMEIEYLVDHHLWDYEKEDKNFRWSCTKPIERGPLWEKGYLIWATKEQVKEIENYINDMSNKSM